MLRRCDTLAIGRLKNANVYVRDYAWGGEGRTNYEKLSNPELSKMRYFVTIHTKSKIQCFSM